MVRLFQLSFWLLAALAAVQTSRAGESAKALTFEADIRPLFKLHCFQCHGEEEAREGNLDLRLRRLALAGGDSGPAIVPGQRDSSLIYQRIRAGEMPPGKTKLSHDEAERIGRWIDAAAPTARPEPEVLTAQPLITEEERSYWAFQPIKTLEPPKVQQQGEVRTPIDAFLLQKLQQQQLAFAPPADKPTLLRRATFGLLGLPPTLEEMEAFAADEAPDAYERLLDRLLASPHYGERWGRHWLDVAGYADSEGFTAEDLERKHAWRYRDYVIRAFNADKPLNDFIVEQLAGDELLTPPYANLSPEAAEKLTATGFLRMAPDPTAAPGTDQRVLSNQVVADTLKIVSSSLLGLTVACAQCHDHRYDPIPQSDYYRLRAIFEPAFNWQQWRPPAARLISLATEADRKQSAEIEAEAAHIDAARKQREQQLIDETFDKELAKLPEELHAMIRAAWSAPAKERSEEQKKLLKEHPSTNVSAGSLYLYNKQAADELKKMAAQAASVRAKKPSEGFVQALTEVPGKLPVMHLFARGDHEQPKQAVSPGELLILAAHQPPVIAEKDPALPTSGRRLAYARWLTSGKHPLVARVLANRVWMHHFGQGIVATPGDFGTLGERPTHPELLDWLAADFMSGGWRLKRLHKQIMLSTAYRQSSARQPSHDAVDPDNRLYGRKSLLRLDAEALRDCVLATSGKLNRKMFGAPVPVMADEVGQFVVGIENLNAGRPQGVIPLKGEEFRRSLYIQVRRSRPLSMLSAFDAPLMEPNCEARNQSTVAPQSLLLMNNEFVIAGAVEFARRIIKEADTQPAAQIALACRLAWGRNPTAAEQSELEKFLAEQTGHFQSQPAAGTSAAQPKPAKAEPPLEPALQALATLCQALWSASEFLYIE